MELALFSALRFYATGSYQKGIGQEFTCGLAQPTVHKYVQIITNLLLEHVVPEEIKFPTNVEEQIQIKREFFVRWGFPGCIGAIDGTHIAILKPAQYEHNFINRKGYHSFNCQMICDPNMLIRNINANYGGSTHDSFIFNHSQVKYYMERTYTNDNRLWLIGDSGYAQLPYLMTPFRNPRNRDIMKHIYVHETVWKGRLGY